MTRDQRDLVLAVYTSLIVRNIHGSDLYGSRSRQVSEVVALEGLLARHPEENPLHQDWKKREDPPVRLRDLVKGE